MHFHVKKNSHNYMMYIQQQISTIRPLQAAEHLSRFVTSNIIVYYFVILHGLIYCNFV